MFPFHKREKDDPRLAQCWMVLGVGRRLEVGVEWGVEKGLLGHKLLCVRLSVFSVANVNRCVLWQQGCTSRISALLHMRTMWPHVQRQSQRRDELHLIPTSCRSSAPRKKPSPQSNYSHVRHLFHTNAKHTAVSLSLQRQSSSFFCVVSLLIQESVGVRIALKKNKKMSFFQACGLFFAFPLNFQVTQLRTCQMIALNGEVK